MGKSRITTAFQETAVHHIDIPCLIHAHEFLHHKGMFFLIHVAFPKGLHLVNKILCHSLHTGKQGNILEFEVEQLYDFLFFPGEILVFHIMEIHQLIF